MLIKPGELRIQCLEGRDPGLDGQIGGVPIGRSHRHEAVVPARNDHPSTLQDVLHDVECPEDGGRVSMWQSRAYPLCGETLEPLERFVRKLPKDSSLAENGFPGLINQEFLWSFSTDKSICSA